jgi:hypothetical protein
MIAEHSMVVLTSDRPMSGLFAGDVGAVVHAYANGAAYEVEFVDGDGSTVACITLDAKDVRSMNRGELLHIRRYTEGTNNPMDRSGGSAAS